MAARESTSSSQPDRNSAAQAPSSPTPQLSGAPAADGSELAMLPEYLRGLIRNLQRIMSVVIVSVAALEHQNADVDSDVAHVLRSYAGNKLYGEIESAGKLLKALERASRPPAE